MMVKRHRNESIGISSGVMDRRYEPELVSRLRAFQLGPYFSYSLSQGVVPDAIETEVCRRGINKCRARSTSGERSSQRRVFPESFPSIDLREAARLKTRVREFLSESAIYRTLDRGRVQDDATREFARPNGRVRRGDIGERTIDRDCRRFDPDDRYPIVVELVHACYRDIPPALTRTRDPVVSLFGARVTRRGERRQGSTTADMRMKMPRMLLFLAIGLLAKVSGLPNGAPRETCSDLIPRHPGGSLQSSYPPYQVLPAAGRGRVRLILGSPQGLAYEGFMILARDIDSGEFVGEFTNLPDSARIVECIQGVKNGVTHTNTNKKHNLEFDWEAPVDYEGTIIFNSTFAQDYSTYWVGVESPRVTVDKRSIDVLTPSTPVTTFRTTTPPYYSRTVNYVTQNEEDPFYTGCHITKNCFGAPAGCIKTKDCAAVVAVIVQGDEYHFELQARREAKYVAVGLSDDKNMGDDSVVECTNEDGEIALHTSWNSGKHNTRHATPEGAIELESASIKNDVIYCKFRRDKLTVIQGRTYDLVNTPYHLLVAAGKNLRRNGVNFHDIVYLGTSTSKKLSDVGEWIPASDLLIRLHGALMLASWIGTASIGMLLARYYRQTWVNSQLCGKDHWFAWHRFFMVLTWSMTIAAFVIIFVELGTWSSETIHASVGLATTILCFIQPFMAAMRPHPGAPRRALFNWAHWFVGNVAKICALIALFFAVRLNKAKLPEWVDWILTAYVVFYVLIHLILTFLGCVSDRQASQRVNSFPMKDMHSRGSMVHPDARRDAPHSGMRKFIFGVYFVVIVAFAATLIVITVLAPIEETWATFTNTF